jgi:hypothetical protein
MNDLEFILFLLGLLTFPLGIREVWSGFRGRTRSLLLAISVALFLSETLVLFK